MKRYTYIILLLLLTQNIFSQNNDAATKKTTTTSDFCSYFPVKNGLKFTYRRNNMLGNQTITETYTAVKEKLLKSGKLIKGYKISSNDENRNNTIIYYYCEKGAVKFYSEMPNYITGISGYVEDYSILPSDNNKPDYQKTPIWETEKTGSGKYLSFTELKSGSVGDSWKDVQIVNDNPAIITNTIEGTDLSVTVNGHSYSPVIHISRKVSVKVLGQVMELNTQDVYYAKGIGKIKTVENGQNILSGSYTTTQELVSHNLPATAIKTSATTENKNQTKPVAKKAPQKLNAYAIEMLCNQWCGSYKLVEKNGKPVSDFPENEYLHLETEGDAVSMILRKSGNKLYETGKQTGLAWWAWLEDDKHVLYIRTAAEAKGKPVSSESIPRKKLIYNNKVYEYVTRNLQYN